MQGPGCKVPCHGLLHSRLCWADPRKIKKIYSWTNKCKWSVSILSVYFHGEFALKFERRKFSIHLESTVKLPLDETLTNVNSLPMAQITRSRRSAEDRNWIISLDKIVILESRDFSKHDSNYTKYIFLTCGLWEQNII